MRIISGKYKGRKLNQPFDKKTRPLKDITKESIFNLLRHSKKVGLKIENSNVLDVFSGSGSFGLECFSRKAGHVAFIESYHLALNVIKKNLDLLKLKKNYQLIDKNAFDNNAFSDLRSRYDLIFLDPPYKEKNIEKLMLSIFRSNLIKKNGLIIIHRHKKSKDKLPKEFEIVEEKLYGVSKIIFLKLR